MRWKDQSTSWEPLKDLKQSFPVQVAEFAVRGKIWLINLPFNGG
jgi:hypothetical protein